MNYKVAVYVDDYLTLLELTEQLEKEVPLADLIVFGDEKVALDAPDIISSDLSGIEEADILIMTAEPKGDANVVVNFDGTVIDAIGYKYDKDTEVVRVFEPIKEILSNLNVGMNELSANLYLPAVIFGKNGVEDLMRQSKEIFTFEASENLVFTERIAFNVHFTPKLDLAEVNKTLHEFNEKGADIECRIAPLSTIFVLDVFATTHFELIHDKGYVVPESHFTASDIAEYSDIFVIKRKRGYTFTGDYLRVRVSSIVNKLKEVM